MRYRPTPASPAANLTAPKRTRAVAVQNSSWDVDLIKRTSRDALGSKDAAFRGDESDRNVLWTSLVTSLQSAFELKDTANDTLFDLADATKEVNNVYNAILFTTLTSLTKPHSPARRWVNASGRASPRDGKRALLEVTKRLLPRILRPLGNYEELCAIYFDSKLDPDPLIQDFDACMTAIRNAASGPLDDMVAKKQLLASLDPVMYDKVTTPLRLDVDLAKVDLEDIYAHILEIWESEHGVGRAKQPKPSPPTSPAMLYSGDVNVKDLIMEFEKQLEAATSTLVALKDSVTKGDEPLSGFVDSSRRHPQRDGKRGVSFPPSRWRDERNRRDDGKFHGRDNRVGGYGGRKNFRFAASPLKTDGNWSQNHYKKNSAHNISFHVASSAFVPECARCPPGHFHDTANCPTDDMACAECDLVAADENDEIVSAFQTAFDAQDDATFARLCGQHDQPVVRHDEEPFTFADDNNIGLRAQYAGLIPSPPSLLATRVHEARTALRELKQVAGGVESAPQHFPMVHFGTATPAVIDESIAEPEPQVTIDNDEGALIFPKRFVDNETPFEQSFMDGMSVKLGFFEPEPQVSLKSFSPLPPYISSTHDSASVADSESGDEELHVNTPPPAPRVGGVRAPSIGSILTAAALPALFMCVSMALLDTVTASALCGVEIAPRAVVSGQYFDYQNCAMDFFPDSAFLDSGPADPDDNFNLDSGSLGFDTFDFFNLNFEIDSSNFNSELYFVDRFQSG
ncbi:hypothetical protein CYMTET_51658 [Cymbomonas tetramitiformis]|uniref:Uncharacterized protein n=1 Tax=Cymbomonas tetramitiformis TaxID=36881 RepID=A0AAE0BLT4_9CHLO|nr:hypothetical protein CYMTET_51658 [Cymbomonas tetramitiformis]